MAKSKKKLPALCAWCRKFVLIDGKEVPLSETGLKASEIESHGICRKCAEEIKADYAATKSAENPPPWATSRATWKKAESVVSRSYRGKKKPEEYYAVVADVYKQIGGKVKRKARGNPSPEEWDAVISIFEQFHKYWPTKVMPLDIDSRTIPAVLARLGELKGVIYISDKWGDGKQSYIHNFKASDRPILATDSDGTHLYILGGSYRIKPEGIVG